MLDAAKATHLLELALFLRFQIDLWIRQIYFLTCRIFLITISHLKNVYFAKIILFYHIKL